MHFCRATRPANVVDRRALQPGDSDQPTRPLYLEIFATSLAAILLEIAYTRIFSFKVFYYFTYLIIGVGLLGIGAGGVAVATWERLRKADPRALLPPLCFAGGASILVGYYIISPTQLNVSRVVSDPGEILKLLGVSLLLTVPFFVVGVIISTILGSRPDQANRLYAADLLGAALGCSVCIPLIQALDPPRVVLLSGLVLTLGGFRLGWQHRRHLIAGVVVALAVLLPVAASSLVTDPVVAKSKSLEDFRRENLVRFSEWSAVFRIDVAEHPFYPGDLYLVFHDGQPGSGLRRFDGDLERFASLRQDARALPFEVLPDDPRVLIIGAAGGHEILASLFFGASDITGVELNPVTVSLLTNHFAETTGHLPDHPKVDLINGDGRWFLKQTEERYDLIWFVAPDSYAAMNAATSGAFVLSESYLYTAEMLVESLKHLSDRGIVCTQFGELDYAGKPNRTTRYLATAREAYSRLGIEDFGRHVLVASAAGYPPFLESVVLLGKKPFTRDRIEAFLQKSASIDGGIVRYVPTRPPDTTPVNQVISLPAPELEGWLENHPYQVHPVVDDSPFFWHFARFRDAIAAPLPGGGIIIDYEDSIAEQVTLVFLLVVVFLATVFLLLPLRAIRHVWGEIPHKTNAALYFTSLGLGFMFIEIALIQKLTLFLGYPTYSLTVTLFGVLVFSGLGSLLSDRFMGRRNTALFAALGALVVLVAAYQLLLPWLIDRFIGSPLSLRIGLTTLLIGPVGLCLGAFMPIGLRTVAETTEHPRLYVAWAWAINGFFSVIASILSTIIAMAVGFTVLFMAALAIYAVGVLALTRIPAARAAPS